MVATFIDLRKLLKGQGNEEQPKKLFSWKKRYLISSSSISDIVPQGRADILGCLMFLNKKVPEKMIKITKSIYF